MDNLEPLVSVIIVNYNGEKYLEKCLSSVLRQTYKNIEVIFVDNCSKDNSIKIAYKYSRKFKNILILRLSKNYGYAAANNIGFHFSKGKYILLLNNDAYLSENTIKILVKLLEKRSDIGIAQPKILLTENRGVDSCGSYLTFLGVLYHPYHLQKDCELLNKPRLIFSAKGACMIIRRDIIERMGLFDPCYFAYYEDTDLCHRAWLLGYKVLYVPLVKVYHEMGGTFNKRKELNLMYLLGFRNLLRTYLKNFEMKNAIPFMINFSTVLFTMIILFLIMKEINKANAIIMALALFIRRLKDTIRKRRIIQRARILKDKSYLFLIKKPSLSYFIRHFITSIK